MLFFQRSGLSQQCLGQVKPSWHGSSSVRSDLTVLVCVDRRCGSCHQEAHQS